MIRSCFMLVMFCYLIKEIVMKATLRNLKSARGNPAVSIFVKTHRTHPENEQDAIALKNQLKVAEERIINEHDKRTSDTILSLIHAKTDELDHNYNLDTLAIFANEEEAQVLRLPFNATERVILGEKFATRDIVREMSQSVHYYVLVLTSEYARLIEAVNDRVVKEIGNTSERQAQMSELTFPINNTSLPTGSKADRTGSSDDDRYLKEFMNRVDKSMQEFRNIDPLPVILVGDARTLGFYEQVVDNDSFIIGKVNHLPNLKDGRAQEIVAGVQEVVDNQRLARYEAAQGDLEKARNEKMVRTDLQQIYRSAMEGNIVKLLVRQGHIVPATIDETALTLMVANDPTVEGVTDDAVSEIIEIVSHHGGEVVFLPQDVMDENEPIALITRY